MSNGTNRSGNGWARWVAIGLTAAIAVVALTVQWGVVTTKLDHVEKRVRSPPARRGGLCPGDHALPVHEQSPESLRLHGLDLLPQGGQ